MLADNNTLNNQTIHRGLKKTIDHDRVWIGNLLILFVFVCGIGLNAQVPLPLSKEIIQRLEPEMIRKNPYFFSCWAPYNELQFRQAMNVDSILGFGDHKRRTRWFGRKLLKESFLQVDSPDFSLRIDPLFNVSLGKDLGDSKKLMTNTRGFWVRLRLGQAIGIESSFYENQSIFPQKWDEYITKYRVSPGQGRAKRYHKTGWDYAYSSGSLTWKPKGIFFFQLGHDKNFVGNGYRSLLLSDASTNYPFLRFSLSWKKIQYTRTIAAFENLDYTTINKDVAEFPKKAANFHVISINVLKKVQLSFFEGVILKNPDSAGRFKLNYDLMNPIPYSDLLQSQKQVSGKRNTILGMNALWRLWPTVHIYNQWAWGDPFHKESGVKPGKNKYGYQVGFKYYQAFTVQGLYVQVEFNKVQPFFYSHVDSTLAYSHFSQPLAHPLGANFYETTGIVNYRFKRFYLEYKITSAVYGTDEIGASSGKDILRPQVHGSDAFLQGIKTDLISHQARVSFYVNPAANSSVNAGACWQDQKAGINKSSTKMFYISFSTNLRNLYHDF